MCPGGAGIQERKGHSPLEPGFGLELLLLVTALFATPAFAREYSPRVISPHRADAYSLRTFSDFPRWRDLRGDARAWEIYRYLVDTRSGLFHFNEVLEGDETLSEHSTVRDPIKIINVYGYGYCAIFGPVMAGIAEGSGIGEARTVVLPGWSHVTSEAFYEGSWHYLDIDVRAAFRRPDGSLASLDDARRDASLWAGRGPLFFPNDSLEATRRVYESTAVHHYHGFEQAGHTMDFVLRQGETLTRWWKPQGGRWSHRSEYNSVDWLRRLIEEAPRGPKPNHRHFSVHDHANGRFVYAPDLTDRSTDFEDGAWDSRNVSPSPRGLTLSSAGEGFATFEVRTPYVIVPLVGDLDDPADDREASVVETDADGMSLQISLDGARTWALLDHPGGRVRLDLTPHVSGTYGYLLRAALRGKPGEAVLRSLRVTTWVQVAPAALPALGEGKNLMEYRTGDHNGLRTRVLEVRPRCGDRDDLLRYLVERPREYDPDRPTERIHGSIIARIDAPPGARIAWFTAEGSFRTYLHDEARRTRNSIAWAAGRPEGFTEVYTSHVPLDTEHWHMNGHAEVLLPEPAATIFVRFVGDPALNAIHAYAHCLDDGRRSDAPVEITHAWTEKGAMKTRKASLEAPGTYEVVTGTEPEDVSVEMAVPSAARK